MTTERVTNRIDLNSPTANMFGIEPCPKCNSEFRYLPTLTSGRVIRCDDCGFEETAQRPESPR